ncbi:peptidoglycan-associated lipoprotein [Roseivivax halotolerans]|jgi:peptidoglycan-associated lipoprotein|uniref:Peptidoglycan-associated lipoprotein n=1 Tax=Roseivivax halotolerans TaxID=93684 RepID=A0A1I5UJW7_9RHOB|nr:MULTISPECIES: peptidoglycan-associated lipoprotein Pal [Roseivivax]QFT64499.1 Outer membrane lipoprotein Omp16 precursor [Roseivivax sp. THAF30]SFP95601.1 peptidoglycan-associated lipoprotein [Roseivivax halotolerans]
MRITTFTSLALIATIAIAGCTRADRFGEGADGAGGAGGMAGANAGVVPGSANDPTSAAYFNQTIGDRVLFAVDQSTLSPSAQDTLRQQAQWLTSNPSYQAVIEGHADEQGTREYNLALGARRANAVMEYLVAQGVAESRLRFVSYGKERPIEVCSTESCYMQNRRAVTVIAGGALS